jgi:hypothetical protein
MGDEIIQIVDEKRDKDDVNNDIVSHNPRDPHNAHNGKQISLVSLSPSGTHFVTYSYLDKSIEGWTVKGSKLILDPEANVYKLSEKWKDIKIKVNDSKVVCCYNDGVEIFLMSNEHQQIKLNPPSEMQRPRINFNKNGDLVIFDNDKISIYHSTHDEMSNELSLMSSHKLLNNKVIKGVSIDDNDMWIISPNDLFHLDLKTFQLKFSYSLGFTSKNIDEKFTVIHQESLIGIKYNNEIAIFLENVHFPIRNIQLKNSDMKIELCKVQNNVYLLAFNIPEKDEKQNIILYNITDINKQQPIEIENDSKNKFILYEYNSKSKKAFGLVNEKFSYSNLSDLDWHEFFESQSDDDDFVGWNDYLCQTTKYYYNDTLAFLDMENIKSKILQL